MAEIYQSSQVSGKADISVVNPFSNYVYADDGDPLSGGKLYFGMVGRDGRVDENQKKVYAINENGGATVLEQPVILSAAGIPQLNGNPVILAVDGSYSLAVDDSDDNQQYYAPKVTAKTLLGYSGVIPEESQIVGVDPLITFNSIEATTASFYISEGTTGNVFKGRYLKKDLDYTVANSSQIRLTAAYQQGVTILGRALDPTGQSVDVTSGSKPLYIFPNKADAIAADLAVGDSVLINGGDTEGDGKGGSYLVVSPGSGTPDDYRYILMSNGNQLKIKSVYQLFKYYSETVSTGTINSGEITIDPSLGNIAKVELTEDISKINILNVPDDGELKVQIEIKQDATGSRALTWSINTKTPKTAGGTLPTVTQTANAVDEYIVKTNDGGDTWVLFTIGQDIK